MKLRSNDDQCKEENRGTPKIGLKLFSRAGTSFQLYPGDGANPRTTQGDDLLLLLAKSRGPTRFIKGGATGQRPPNPPSNDVPV